MSFTPTTNYNLLRPDISTEIDTWGDDLNDNWVKVDTQLKTNADAAAAKLPLAGGTLTGVLITMLSGTASAGLRLPHGAAPTAPVNGDFWSTTAALFVRLNGTTQQLATSADLTAGLATKANTSHSHAESDVTGLVADLAAKAPLASPALTGTPTVPTAAAGTNTTQAASTAYVYDAVTKEIENPQAGNYTLAITDVGKMVSFSAAAVVTVNSGVFSADHRIDILQLGTGAVSFAGTATRRIFPSAAIKLAGQYAGATIFFLTASEYVVIGNVIA